MAAKFFVVLSLAVAASALPVLEYAEHEAPAHYDFEYSVHDQQSGDIKQQKESRAGDAVQGFYSLVQPDGVHRIVEYTSDKVNGFNANVRYEGHPVAQPAKIAYAAPVAKLAYSAPVAYAAPVAKIAYSAPVAKIAYSTPIAKFFVVLSLAVAASALPVLEYAEHEAPAHYDFEYSVHDQQSGDIKQQKESRAGDAVQGFYSLVQPDGVHRIVEYTSDKVNGFNANVRYEGHPVAQPAKIAYAAPVAKLAYSAPVAYAAPVAKIAYSAPVAKIAYSAPIAKVAYAAPVAKIAYNSAPLTQVTFSSPAISYHH
ncbi:cuticle protein 18.6-like [Bombyx mandarina]|uniref:Cuticle protein 18.6-like n=1 Tax=Bombyx mandarina TaxID=7092 RepID=A0A6J2JKG8_BOMMA|nr:cuticle protein 18.6-like [Bombyx mandarina]